MATFVLRCDTSRAHHNVQRRDSNDHRPRLRPAIKSETLIETEISTQRRKCPSSRTGRGRNRSTTSCRPPKSSTSSCPPSVRNSRAANLAMTPTIIALSFEARHSGIQSRWDRLAGLRPWHPERRGHHCSPLGGANYRPRPTEATNSATTSYRTTSHVQEGGFYGWPRFFTSEAAGISSLYCVVSHVHEPPPDSVHVTFSSSSCVHFGIIYCNPAV